MLDALNHESFAEFCHHHIWMLVFFYVVIGGLFAGSRA